MTRDRSTPIRETFELYLQDVGKGRGGSGGNYRRNVARELDRFAAWAAGDRGESPIDRTPPTVAALDERVFRAYARHLAGDRGLKRNTVQTYYAYVSAWCGWLVDEGYLDGHYAQRATATAPLPTDDGRKPGDQQAWTPEQRHALTRYADRLAREAIDALGPTDGDEPTDGVNQAKNDANETTNHETEGTNGESTADDRARRERRAIRAARDRALVYVLAYTAVRVGEVVRDPDDPRRRGLRWEDVNLDDRSLTVYRKKQSWDATGVPDPVVPPLRRLRRLLDPPDDRWPVFPTFDRRTLSERVTSALADRGLQPDEIDRRRDRTGDDLFVARAEHVRPPSVTTDGARSVLRRLTDAAEIDVDHPKHDYLAPHGGRRGMGEVLVRAFGYTVAARYLDNSEAMVRERYSHIEAGELGDVATDALDEIDPDGAR